jgi:phosphoribosylanthranilate isomerase
MRVKVCGIKNMMELEIAERYADETGVVAGCSSKRAVDFSLISKIISRARIPVFVVSARNTYEGWIEIIEKTSADYIQIHSEMKPEEVERIKKEYDVFVAKAFFVPSRSMNPASDAEKLEAEIHSYEVDRILLDTGCGTGSIHDFRVSRIIAGIFGIFLAGGLNSSNVREIADYVKPAGVDVSGGVEKDGKKSEELVREFVKKAKEYRNPYFCSKGD